MPSYSIPRRIWRVIFPVLILIAVSGVVELFALFISTVSGIVFEWLGKATIAAEIHLFIINNAYWRDLLSTVINCIIFFVIWRKAHTTYSVNKITFMTFVMLVGMSIGLCYVFEYIINIMDLIRFFPSYEDFSNQIFSGSIPFQILAIGICAPIMEELCFRGIVFDRLKCLMPTWLAILVSSVLFGIIHMNLFQCLYATVLGVALALIYVRYHNLLAPIIAHMAFNLAAVFSPTSIEVLSRWIILLPIALIFVRCSWMLIKRQVKETNH